MGSIPTTCPPKLVGRSGFVEGKNHLGWPFPRIRGDCPNCRSNPLVATSLALIAGNSSLWLPFLGWTRLGGTYMIQILTELAWRNLVFYLQ
jgi:hypothetical protein